MLPDLASGSKRSGQLMLPSIHKCVRPDRSIQITIVQERTLPMKRSFLLLFVILFLLSACAEINAADPGREWTVYQAASDSLVNPGFPAYRFEYPSYWVLEEGANSITFASEATLLQVPPESLGAGQILAGLSINEDMPPAEMVESYTSTLGSTLQFGETNLVRLNGRPAAYQEGLNPETSDAALVLAVDMGEETRGLLTARMAEGELEKWEEILFKMAESLQVEP